VEEKQKRIEFSEKKVQTKDASPFQTEPKPELLPPWRNP